MSIFSNFLASISKSDLPLKPIRVLGIDLGTTNSAAAEIIWDPQNPENAEVSCLDVDQMTLEGRHTNQLVPSVVALYNDQTFIGEGAKRLRTIWVSQKHIIRRQKGFALRLRLEVSFCNL
jgi:molecular chaperone DnaK (HSP70)